jgi:peptide/nickel transport system substrate-binding protein
MTLRQKCISAVAAVALAVTVAACGSSGPGASTPAAASQSRVLRLAFYADMRTVDPDSFYDIEGDAVTQSVYDGLLHYAPNSATLAPALAKSWEVAKNGLTYTFRLRSARFSDGSPVTSAAVETSFKRRTAINQGPAYMLAEVRSYQTPSTHIFVVHMKKPVSDFLNLMASVWGPKVINPKVLAAHKSGDAQKYLSTHAAGTGPFMLTKFQQGTGYVLTRNPYYWGAKPYFHQVDISIQPDVSTQLLELERGSLDAVLHGVPISSLASLDGVKGITVHKYSSLDTVTLAMNQDAPGFANASVRRAVVDALDLPTLVSDVFGGTATVMPSTFPAPLLASGLGNVSHPYDVSQIKAALPKGLKLKVVYTPDSSGVEQRFADFMRQRLAQFGVTVDEQLVQLSTVYGYPANPKQGADIYISTPTPDAAAPDAWARTVWYTKGGLNFFDYSNPRVNALINAGQSSTSKARSDKDYAEAGILATDDASEVPVAQVNDVIITRSDLTGVEHVPAYPWTLNLATLTRK